MRSNLSLLRIVISTEILKLRNTVALWLTLLYPFGTVFLSSLFHYAERNHVFPDQVNFINNFNSLAAFFLPFYAVLMVSFFCQMEHRNSMLKHLYSLPVPKWAFYYGKLIASFLMLAVAWLMLIVFLYIAMLLLGSISPKLRITAAFDHVYLLLLITQTFLSAAALVVIQYILSLKLKNVVAPVAIGTTLIILPIAVLFVLGITGLISNPRVLQWLPKYDPYSFPFSFVFNVTNGGPVKQELFSTPLLTWFLVALAVAILGYFEVRKRNIK
jgi:lantibiotic transport system permease protein